MELAGAYLKIGDVQGYPLLPNLGHREAALQSYRKALHIAEALVAAHGDPEGRRLVARSHQRVAAMLVGLQRGGAIDEYRRGLVLADALYAAKPDNPEDADLLVTILTTLGQAEAREGSVAEASRHWLRTVDVARRAAEKNPGEAARWRPMQSYQVVIRALMYAGDLELAERTSREGIRIREALAAADPANANLRRNLMNAYLELGYIYFHPSFLSFDDSGSATAFHEKALQIARELAASDPNNATAQTDLALAEAEACAAWNGSDPTRGIAYCRDAIAIAGRWPALLTTEAISASLADGLHRLGRYPEALESLRSAVATCERLLQRSPWRFNIRQKLVRAYNQMGDLLLESGDAAGAIEYHRRALALAEELSEAKPSNLLSKRDMADTYEALGKYYEARNLHEAQAWYRKSLDIWKGWPGFAVSSRMDVARRKQAEEAVARCDAR